MCEIIKYNKMAKCKICGKNIAIGFNPEWRYKDSYRNFYCSWHCLQESRKNKVDRRKKENAIYRK